MENKGISAAIKIAIENGWRLRNGWEGIRIEELPTAHPNIAYWYRDTPTGKEYMERVEMAEICLDPLFWQALGRGLGWSHESKYGNGEMIEGWQMEWHLFIDHLASNGDIDSFFNELTK